MSNVNFSDFNLSTLKIVVYSHIKVLNNQVISKPSQIKTLFPEFSTLDYRKRITWEYIAISLQARYESQVEAETEEVSQIEPQPEVSPLPSFSPVFTSFVGNASIYLEGSHILTGFTDGIDYERLEAA